MISDRHFWAFGVSYISHLPQLCWHVHGASRTPFSCHEVCCMVLMWLSYIDMCIAGIQDALGPTLHHQLMRSLLVMWSSLLMTDIFGDQVRHTFLFSHHLTSHNHTMPNLSITTGLLISGSNNGLPWSSPTWQDLTKVDGVPWVTTPGAEPNAPLPNVPSWSTHVTDSIKAYANNLWSKPDTQAKIKHFGCSLADNDTAGCPTWNSWVKLHWNKSWNISHHINDIFTKYKCSPYHVLSYMKVQKVCTMILPTIELTTHCLPCP